MSADGGVGDVFLQLGLNGSPGARRKTPDAPFSILVLAPLSGTAGSATKRSIRRIDADNYEDEFRRMAPALTVEVDGESVELTFGEIEDFEPDRLLRGVPPLAALVDIRKRLKNPATAVDARAEALRMLGLSPAAESAPEAEAPAEAAQEPGGDSFADLLGRPMETKAAPTAAQRPATPGAGIAADLIRSVVADSGSAISPAVDNSGILAGIDAALSERLGRILHDPSFQSLESAWRGIDFLMSTLETDDELRLYMMDIPLEALRAELMGAEDLRTTAFLETVSSHEGVPWAMVLGDYRFTPSDEDVALLGRLGIVTMALGAPFVSGAACGFAGVTSLAEQIETGQLLAAAEGQTAAWSALRGTPVAPYLALTFPRVLMRLPYGGTGEAIDAFDYDEMAGGRSHDHYLWGSGAYLCGYVYGRAYLDQGAQMNPRAYAQVSGLPAHPYTEEGERRMQPCAETWLAESHCQALTGIGLLPMVSVRNRDAVQLPNLTSVAYPAKPLVGRWG